MLYSGKCNRIKNMKFNFSCFWAATLFIFAIPLAHGQVSVTSSYSQNFNSLGTALPRGWDVWTSSSLTGNGTAFTWSGTSVANNASASASNYFRNLPGETQTWTASLSSGADRAIGWRADSAGARDGSITFTFSSTSNWSITGLSFDLFTPNNSGSVATFNLEYQIGSSGTFAQLAGKSYTTNTPQNPLTITSIVLTALDLMPLNDQSGQVTLRLNNTATNGTSWNTLALDNFSYTASPIPESSTYALLGGFAALGLVAYRRKTRLSR